LAEAVTGMARIDYLLPLSQYESFRIPRGFILVVRVLLIHKIGAGTGCSDFEGPNAMEQEMHGPNFLAGNFTFVECVMPFTAQVIVHDDRPLQVLKRALAARSEDLLDI
jgi:hypothetical protein